MCWFFHIEYVGCGVHCVVETKEVADVIEDGKEVRCKPCGAVKTAFSTVKVSQPMFVVKLTVDHGLKTQLYIFSWQSERVPKVKRKASMVLVRRG